jgi:hypothetical protein
MRLLKNKQRELLFDYCVGITSEKETTKAKELISSNKEATKIHRKLKTALAPLESIRPELCPNLLAERTIFWILSTPVDSNYQLQISEQTQSTIALTTST